MDRRLKWAAVGAAATIAAASITWLAWPSKDNIASYPFAHRMPGPIASPLWEMSPSALEALLADDTQRLERALDRLDAAVRFANENPAILKAEKPEDLRAEDRRRAREIWWSYFEPMLAIDELKSRHSGWYGIDYIRNPGLHARSYGLAYAALCAQVYGGLRLLKAIEGKTIAPSLFDEAMPELGVPAGTFREMRSKLARAQDQSLVPVGARWFNEYIEPHLRSGPVGQKITALVVARRGDVLPEMRDSSVTPAAANAVDVVKGEAFARWFPLQKEVAEWAGDTRVAPEGRRLISDAQLAVMKANLKPGDIIIERRNWYLSNIGLPGFWPHAALYVGTQDELRAAFDDDKAVKAKLGGAFSERVAAKHPKPWKELGEKDAAGHPRTVLEAVSEGVVTASLEHSCGADYVAVLRPRLPPAEVAAAIDRALGYFGRPYDFNFNFATDDEVVCSELVMKAYEPSGDGAKGLTVPFITVAGRRAVPPTEIVRVFAAERAKEDRQLDFVYFLDGKEKTRAAVVADAEELALSAVRPKWDIVQP